MKGRTAKAARSVHAAEEDQPPSASSEEPSPEPPSVRANPSAGRLVAGVQTPSRPVSSHPRASSSAASDARSSRLARKEPTKKAIRSDADLFGPENGQRIEEQVNGPLTGTKPTGPKVVRARRPNQTIRPSERSLEFLARYFPAATQDEWNDWRWQVRTRLRTLAHVEKVLTLSEDERSALSGHSVGLPVGVTPYYASLLDRENPSDPLRRTVIPVSAENVYTPGEARDPLGEDGHSPVPGLVHRYPDRVLFLVSAFCSVYCRYCTRSRVVGHFEDYTFNRGQWERAIEYVEQTPTVRDVLISGGDPLDLSDENLEWLLQRLRAIKHVEFLRIGTKVPAVLPQRVTLNLVRMLKKYHPLWMSIHFTHPAELTPETVEACGRLADAGIPLGSQSVLLRGVNDDADVLKSLFHGLLRARVRPYYLYQCDPIVGSAHLRTPVERGLEIIKALRGFTTGYAVPTFVIDGPGGGGKIPLLPEYFVGRDGDDILLRSYDGKIVRYPDPVAGSGPVAVALPPASVPRADGPQGSG